MKKYLAEVKISLRRGILDAQGKAIENSLHSLEFQALTDIKVGKFIQLQVEAENKEKAVSIVDSASKKLLANTIIEDYSIHLEEIN